jgi:hypothetical protein
MVFSVMVAPFRPLITPETFWPRVATLQASTITNAARVAGIVKTDFTGIFVVMGFLDFSRPVRSA